MLNLPVKVNFENDYEKKTKEEIVIARLSLKSRPQRLSRMRTKQIR